MAINHDALNKAYRDLEVGIQETLADFAESDMDVSEDDIWHDLVVSFAWDMDDDTAREWCRTQIGNIPWDLRARLGDTDWII